MLVSTAFNLLSERPRLVGNNIFVCICVDDLSAGRGLATP